MSLFDTIKPEFLDKIRQLSIKHKISLFERIKKEQDELNLKSLLTEASFGIYFDTIGDDIKYNQGIGDQRLTPDFLFKVNSQEIVAEVCHVNPTQRDMDSRKAEDLLFQEIRQNNPGAPLIGNVHFITWKPDKLYGENGSIAQKANKYGPLVEQTSRPLILCVYLEFISGLDALDLNHSLYGLHGEYKGEFEFQGYYPNTEFHDLSQGLFYRNEQMRKNVSGVLLRANNGNFVYYHNFSSTNRLSQENIYFFSNMQHPYD